MPIEKIMKFHNLPNRTLFSDYHVVKGDPEVFSFAPRPMNKVIKMEEKGTQTSLKPSDQLLLEIHTNMSVLIESQKDMKKLMKKKREEHPRNNGYAQ